MNATTDQLYQALLDGPAMDPPLGVTVDFVDPPNLQRKVIIALTLYTAFATLVILMRLYTKVFLFRKTVFEDYVVVLGWLLGIASSLSSGMIVKYGGGVHQWNVQLKTFFRMLYWVNIASILYSPTLFVIKFSIFLQYIRIFVPNRQANLTMWVVAHVVIGVIFIFYVVTFGFNLFMCRPREKYWNRLQTGSCYDWDASLLGTGFFNVFSDFALLMLPVRDIWKLHVPFKKKLGILAVFATGLLACIVSIVRTYYTFKLINSKDMTYNLVVMGFWTQAEITFGIMISCFPVLPRLMKVFRSRVQAFSSRFKTNDVIGGGTSGSAFKLTHARRQRGKKFSDGFVDLQDSHPKGGEKILPFRRRELLQSERHLNSLTSMGDCAAPPGEDINDEQSERHLEDHTY